MKEAVEALLPLERDLFLKLNGSDYLFLDNLMWMFSGRLVWIPLFLFIIFLFFYKNHWKEGMLLTLFFIHSLRCVIKSPLHFQAILRTFRPTSSITRFCGYGMVTEGGRYGFISSHATNSFGLAVFLSLLYRYRWLTVGALFWAMLNSYTRIYLGVHFISDILAGMIVGIIAFVLFGSIKLYVVN